MWNYMASRGALGRMPPSAWRGDQQEIGAGQGYGMPVKTQDFQQGGGADIGGPVYNTAPGPGPLNTAPGFMTGPPMATPPQHLPPQYGWLARLMAMTGRGMRPGLGSMGVPPSPTMWAPPDSGFGYSKEAPSPYGAGLMGPPR